MESQPSSTDQQSPKSHRSPADQISTTFRCDHRTPDWFGEGTNLPGYNSTTPSGAVAEQFPLPDFRTIPNLTVGTNNSVTLSGNQRCNCGVRSNSNLPPLSRTALTEIEPSKNSAGQESADVSAAHPSVSLPQDCTLFLRLVKLPTSSLIFPRATTTRHLSPPRDFGARRFFVSRPLVRPTVAALGCGVPSTVNAHLSVMSTELGSTELQRPVILRDPVVLFRTVVSATRHTRPTTSEAGAPSSHTGADLLSRSKTIPTFATLDTCRGKRNLSHNSEGVLLQCKNSSFDEVAVVPTHSQHLVRAPSTTTSTNTSASFILFCVSVVFCFVFCFVCVRFFVCFCCVF